MEGLGPGGKRPAAVTGLALLTLYMVLLLCLWYPEYYGPLTGSSKATDIEYSHQGLPCVDLSACGDREAQDPPWKSSTLSPDSSRNPWALPSVGIVQIDVPESFLSPTMSSFHLSCYCLGKEDSLRT